MNKALIIGIVILGVILTGCSGNQYNRQQAIIEAFTNQVIEIKSTSLAECRQYIVRCEDGSIWEVIIDDGEVYHYVTYKNCLYDAIYRLPVKPLPPVEPPFELEKKGD